METKRFIKTVFGNIFDRENCYVDDRLVGNPLCDTRTGYLIYENHIVAQSDEVVKLFDCFLIVHTGLFMVVHYWRSCGCQTRLKQYKRMQWQNARNCLM